MVVGKCRWSEGIFGKGEEEVSQYHNQGYWRKRDTFKKAKAYKGKGMPWTEHYSTNARGVTQQSLGADEDTSRKAYIDEREAAKRKKRRKARKKRRVVGGGGGSEGDDGVMKKVPANKLGTAVPFQKVTPNKRRR